MLQNICEFRQYSHREGRTFLIGVKWNYIYACSVKSHIFQVKNVLVKCAY
jgi:hypothetical protein